MKAIVIESPGGPEALRLVERPDPEPKAGEVLVRTAALGVNFIDIYFRKGTYPAPHLPLVIGMEGAGTVERAGEGVTDVAAGDRVAWAGVLGSYAELVALPAARTVRVPDGVSFKDAAALMLQGITAHYLANSTFPLAAGNVALVHAGAGGVGLLLTQIAKAKGATVYTTVSTAEKAALSRKAGADHTIDYTTEDFAAEVRRLTAGAGVDVVYDSVGRSTFDKSLDSLRRRGYCVLFGGASGPVPPVDPQTLNAKGSLFLTRPSLGDYVVTTEELRERAADLFAMVASGALSLRMEHEYPLADAARAHIDLEARTTTGKLLLIP